MSRPGPALIPADYTVWVFADPHGARWALGAALTEAGLLDGAGHWRAPARTALVGLGDYIDRGRDSVGLLELLRRLRSEAAAAASMVVLAEGNHEQMARLGLAGDAENRESWLAQGGLATLASLGIEPDSRALRRDERALAMAVHGVAPWFGAFLADLVPWARWRDIALVHAGLAAWTDLAGFTAGSERLWVRQEFYLGRPFGPDLDEPAYAAYRTAGLARVVAGHTPMAGPAFFQAGRIMLLDTNACASPGAGEPAPRLVLVRLPAAGPLTRAQVVAIPTAGAPDRMGRA